jgi:ribosomal protein L12E/L44/L45/RPP1/RPP2
MAADTVQMLKRLKKLLASGGISKKEYDKLKAQALDGKDLTELLNELEEETGKPAPQPATPQPVAPIARAPAARNNVADAVIGITLGILLIAGMLYFFDINIGDFFKGVGDCDPVEGKTFCGFCGATMSCQYCTEGKACNFATPGDTCSKLVCGGSEPTPNIDMNPCDPGYCYSGGHCCPSYARFYCKGNCYDWGQASAEGCTSNTAFC